jgi:hypothetical protein
MAISDSPPPNVFFRRSLRVFNQRRISMDSSAATESTTGALIPPEIWLACWTLCSHCQIRRLSLVCKLFRALCLPLLFHHQNIDLSKLKQYINSGNWIDHLHKAHRTAVRLDRLAEEPRAALVRSWTFISGFRRPFAPLRRNIQNLYLFDNTYDRAITTFSLTLGFYHNLSSLSLKNLPVDAHFRQTLLCLPSLEDLALDSCEIVARDGDLIPLKSFSLTFFINPAYDELPTPPTLRLVSPEHLHTLRIAASHETIPVLTGFPPGKFLSLVKLSLQHLPSLDIFCSFLNQCPRLESLAITEAARELLPSIPESPLSPDTIPRLRHLTAPRELMSFFIPNRPVSSVTVLNPPHHPWRRGPIPNTSAADLKLVFAPISRASIPLLTLNLPLTSPSPPAEFLAAIPALFPELRELSLTIPAEGFRFAVLCSGVRRGTERRESLDTRHPTLCDADAFDDIPPENISDVEEDEPPRIVLFTARETEEIPGRSNLHVSMTDIVRRHS